MEWAFGLAPGGHAFVNLLSQQVINFVAQHLGSRGVDVHDLLVHRIENEQAGLGCLEDGVEQNSALFGFPLASGLALTFDNYGLITQPVPLA